MIPHGDI
jgi:hypothetical protein